MMKILTVFTPTYNRAYILPQLYKSLCSQTNHNFKWLIVDDGSNDTTKTDVAKWIKDEIIEIEYRYQDNAGKMAAYNAALESVNTFLFMCVDSDDFLVPDAVEKILEAAKGIEKRDDLSGIVAYRGNIEGKVIGNCFPQELEYSPLNNLYELGFRGDTTLIYKSQIAKRFMFPILPGEKFVSEMYVYNQIDELYKMKLLREVLTICNYLNDGYTKNGYNLVKNNPMGWALVYHQKKHYSQNMVKRLRYAAFAGSYVMMASKKARKAAYEQNLYKTEIIELITWPVSFLLFLRREWVHRDR